MIRKYNLSGHLALATCLALASSLVGTIVKAESNPYLKNSSKNLKTNIQKGGAIHIKIAMLTPNTKTYTLSEDFHDKSAPRPLPTFGRAEPGSFIRFERPQNTTSPDLFAVRPSAVKTLQQIQRIS